MKFFWTVSDVVSYGNYNDKVCVFRSSIHTKFYKSTVSLLQYDNEDLNWPSLIEFGKVFFDVQKGELLSQISATGSKHSFYLRFLCNSKRDYITVGPREIIKRSSSRLRT